MPLFHKKTVKKNIGSESQNENLEGNVFDESDSHDNQPNTSSQNETSISEELKKIIRKAKNHEIIKRENIESIDNRGIATLVGDHFIIYNEKLFFISPFADGSQALLTINNKFYLIAFNNNQWDLKNNNIPEEDKDFYYRLSMGSILPFEKRGPLRGSNKENEELSVPFYYARIDSDKEIKNPKKFRLPLSTSEDTHDKISTSKGDKLTSALPLKLPGSWNEKEMSEKVNFIKVSNGASGCVGIKIAFSDLPEGQPVLISAGQLSGCTMIYATDNHAFYAYHTGKKEGDEGWFTSQQGVEAVYKTHLALKGNPIDFSENKKFDNNDLTKIFAEYDASLITYFGKNTRETGDTRIKENKNDSGKNIFNYNEKSTKKEYFRVGMAYALLNRQGNRVNVAAYSEDLSIDAKNKKLKILANTHQQLKGRNASFDTSLLDPSKSEKGQFGQLKERFNFLK